MPEKTTQPEPTEGYKAFCRLIAAGAGVVESWDMRRRDAERLADALPAASAKHIMTVRRLAEWETEMADIEARGEPLTREHHQEYYRREAAVQSALYRKLSLGVRIEDLSEDEVHLLRKRPWSEVKKAAAKGGNDYAYGAPYDSGDLTRDGWFLAFVKWHPYDLDRRPDEKRATYKLWVDLRRQKRIPKDIVDRMREQYFQWRREGADPDLIPKPIQFLMNNA